MTLAPPSDFPLEPGETLLFHEVYQAKKSSPFSLAVSNLALYLPAMKSFALANARHFRRVPRYEVTGVELVRLRLGGLVVLGILMVAAGGAGVVWILPSLTTGHAGKPFGYALGLLVAGLALPFAGRGRRRLVIRHQGGTFRWTPPLVLDAASKKEIDQLLERIVHACRVAGMPVVDDGSV